MNVIVDVVAPNALLILPSTLHTLSSIIQWSASGTVSTAKLRHNICSELFSELVAKRLCHVHGHENTSCEVVTGEELSTATCRAKG